MFFEQLIELLNTRPMVPGKTVECLRLWDTLTARQQEHIYNTIRTKLQAGKFVHYDPLKAIQDNIPKVPKHQILSFAEYYKQFDTTEEQGGWKMVKPQKEGDPPVHYVKAG